METKHTLSPTLTISLFLLHKHYKILVDKQTETGRHIVKHSHIDTKEKRKKPLHEKLKVQNTHTHTHTHTHTLLDCVLD